ncbi:ArsR/SmtB family transcription factor [Virgibacillus salexigens]|uniref:Transcriptional regulator n=1 Tax=Virgibacillus kapii TaxID=1638645 RepID=A0ABQ2DZV3_9BACI|nr:metalloregulator ArsR/SmtB family transcription factor [Virgibacillus kapii]GGJ76600.1 transcriptional regulator [Virgibacillus kapii]
MNLNEKAVIFNYMVNHNKDKLNEIFHALADSTRREMVRMMAQKERTVSELAEPFDMSLAGISKHIKVLERAKLVERSVNGRTHLCRLNTESLSQATEWLRFYEKFWNNRFDLLESELLKAKKKEH